MLLYVLRRLALAIVTVWLATLGVFLAAQALPGDVATQLLGQNATPSAVATMRAELGLDKPLTTRYFEWISGTLHGDFGTSLVNHASVGTELALRLRNTLLIAGVTTALGVTLALVLGVVAGLTRDRWPDLIISTFSLVGMSMPEFVIATLLTLLFAVAIPIFPAVVTAGTDATIGQLLQAIWLPALSLTIVMAAYILRMLRTSVIDTMASEYVTTARLKGLSPAGVVVRHALPSALLPTLNVIAMNIAWLIGGVVVVETVFNYPGIGLLTVEAVRNRDLPVLEAVAALSAVTYVGCNLLADLAAPALNPRLRRRSS
ncbi:MAG: transporter, permease protein [Actinomycetia bacterium]|jgi:peptide/nickel transport system permease protein|nr:transporter, permease protein [Actinomycetes bacterium]